MSEAIAIPLIVAGVLIVFPLFWSGIVWIIGTGWRGIAAMYPAEDWPRGGYTLRAQSARIGASSYSGVLTFIASEDGLYIRPMLLFRAGHPSIRIPWGAVERTEPAMLFGTRVVLADAPDLMVSTKLADAIHAATRAHEDSASLA